MDKKYDMSHISNMWQKECGYYSNIFTNIYGRQWKITCKMKKAAVSSINHFKYHARYKRSGDMLEILF